MPAALAIFAHPDDIEFRAAGTLLLLGAEGWDLHYCNLSSGNLGSTRMTAKKTAAKRAAEARAAARVLGATWHPPIADDLAIFYTDRNLRKVCALIRKVEPTVILTHPPMDYMEDHMETCRLTVTAAFGRGIPNYRSIPPRRPTLAPVTLYHSAPHGLSGPLREPWHPELYVDTTAVLERKLAALACHHSQQEWLDASQGMNSYLAAATADAVELGRRSRNFSHAEGFTRHLHLGFASAETDPLRDVLGARYHRHRSAR
jgi:LmbE family N-acetylglucosaminyl deacetylase